MASPDAVDRSQVKYALKQAQEQAHLVANELSKYATKYADSAADGKLLSELTADIQLAEDHVCEVSMASDWRFHYLLYTQVQLAPIEHADTWCSPCTDVPVRPYSANALTFLSRHSTYSLILCGYYWHLQVKQVRSTLEGNDLKSAAVRARA